MYVKNQYLESLGTRGRLREKKVGKDVDAAFNPELPQNKRLNEDFGCEWPSDKLPCSRFFPIIDHLATGNQELDFELVRTPAR